METVLVVDDSKRGRHTLRQTLADRARVLMADSGREALSLARGHDLAFILLDVHMPGMDGFETAKLLRACTGLRDTPIIFLATVSESRLYQEKGYEISAVDFLFKPFDSHLLLAKVDVFLEMYRQKVELERTTLTLHDSLRELQRSHKVVEERNRELRNLSIRDGLTGLYNHRHLGDILPEEFRLARRYGHDLCCIVFDIDFFKEVNDTYGHEAGDLVLGGFSALLKANIRGSDRAFRYGGEEFVVLLPQTNLEGGMRASEKIREFCEAACYQVGEQEVRVTVSAGLASLRRHCPQDPATLIRFADHALYRAKADGRNCLRLYDGDHMVEEEQG